jgi:hypothetical protein
MARESSKILDAAISTAASGDTVIVSGQTAKKIVVHSYAIVASAAVTATWKSASTAKSGGMPFAANSGIACSGGLDDRWFSCGLGEDLVLNLGTAVAVGGTVAYSIEPR